MDRRQNKTRKAIIVAFRELLKTKRYDHITVQEIIDRADVGRSTFYAHFETKDLLLSAICEELFYHIFEDDPCPSFVGKDKDLKDKLAHTLWHIRDSKNDIAGMLLSDSSEIFMRYFKDLLKDMFSRHVDCFNVSVPKDFLLNHLVGSFAETVKWWMAQGMKDTPETVAEYFMEMTETH